MFSLHFGYLFIFVFALTPLRRIEPSNSLKQALLDQDKCTIPFPERSYGEITAFDVGAKGISAMALADHVIFVSDEVNSTCLKGHQSKVKSLCFTENRWLISASENKLCIWDPTAAWFSFKKDEPNDLSYPIREWILHQEGINKVQCNGKGKLLTISRHALEVWDIHSRYVSQWSILSTITIKSLNIKMEKLIHHRLSLLTSGYLKVPQDSLYKTIASLIISFILYEKIELGLCFGGCWVAHDKALLQLCAGLFLFDLKRKSLTPILYGLFSEPLLMSCNEETIILAFKNKIVLVDTLANLLIKANQDFVPHVLKIQTKAPLYLDIHRRPSSSPFILGIHKSDPGKYLFLVFSDSSIECWDIKTKEKLKEFRSYQGFYQSFFNPFIYPCGIQKGEKLSQVKNMASRRSFQITKNTSLSTSFSSKNLFSLKSASPLPKQLYPIQTFRNKAHTQWVISLNMFQGKLLVVTCVNTSLLDLKTWTFSFLQEKFNNLQSICWSQQKPCSFTTVNGSGNLIFWKKDPLSTSWTLEKEIQLEGSSHFKLLSDKKGERLFLVDLDNSDIAVWDLIEKKPLFLLEHQAIERQQSLLCVTGYIREVYQKNIPDALAFCIQQFTSNLIDSVAIQEVCISPAGQLVIAYEGVGILAHPCNKDHFFVKNFTSYYKWWLKNDEEMCYFTLSPDGCYILFVEILYREYEEKNAYIHIYKVGKKTPDVTLLLDKMHRVSAICWSPCSKRIAVGLSKYATCNIIKVFDRALSSNVMWLHTYTLQEHEAFINTLYWHEDNLFSASYYDINVWKIPSRV